MPKKKIILDYDREVARLLRRMGLDVYLATETDGRQIRKLKRIFKDKIEEIL